MDYVRTLEDKSQRTFVSTFAGRTMPTHNQNLQNQQEIDQLKKEVTKLKSAISKCKQFNEKVNLNLKLKEAEKHLDQLM
jgi:hypothetical protein